MLTACTSLGDCVAIGECLSKGVADNLFLILKVEIVLVDDLVRLDWFNQSRCWVVFDVWGPNGLFLGSMWGSKTVLGSTHVVEQLSFCMIP